MTSRPFPWTRTFVIGFGFLGISILWPIFNQFLPLFLQAGNTEFNAQLLQEGRALPTITGFGLAPGLALFIMTWDNLINIFIQPWVGAKSDRTWNRFGRRKSWIMIGVPIAVLGFICIPFAKMAQSLIAVMVFILITDFGMALFRSPTVAWLGDLYIPLERSKANGVINFMGGVGGLLAYFVGGKLFDSVGEAAPFIAGAIALALAMVVTLLFVKEPREIKVDSEDTGAGVLSNIRTVLRNPDKSGLLVLGGILFWFMAFNALETGLSSFAVFSLGMKAGEASVYAASVSLSFMIFAIPAGLIAQKLGRRFTIQIGLTGLTFLLLVGFFLVRSPMVFLIFLVIVGFFWALVNVNSLPLVYDHGDENRIGAYTGLYYLSSQTAAVIGPTLGGVVVQAFGYDYRVLFIFSTVFMALAWVVMTGVDRKKKPELV